MKTPKPHTSDPKDRLLRRFPAMEQMADDIKGQAKGGRAGRPATRRKPKVSYGGKP